MCSQWEPMTPKATSKSLLWVLDTLQRGVQWIGGAVDWGSII